MKLSIIIVNYNVQYFLEQALLSVQKAASNLETEVFVVDNNSVDNSVALVREKFPEVHLIANKNNPGFSIANNQAIRLAKGEYILLLNPDTVVEEDTFEKCVAFMDRHPEAGGLGVKMIDGSGNFLPESKRGFPTPFVAFCKMTGLSRLFPKSKLFNRYHLGFLDKDEIHEVDVLAGAFMLMRRSVLDEVGLLDETFFMYGEDIDLSYRIVKATYKNYYFPDTTIIHYKGESTKKGSLNYVKAFYNAMIIFAKKHFQAEEARPLIWMLQLAIYFQASATLLKSSLRQLTLPIGDATLFLGGLYFLKEFWARQYFNNPEYYQDSFIYFNMPLYTAIWMLFIYLNGGYDRQTDFGKLIRGVFMGTIVLAAVYGFLDLAYRSSRVLIILGALWAMVSGIGWRAAVHFIRYRNFDFQSARLNNLVIIGSKEESDRVLSLIHQAHIQKNYIGTVSPASINNHDIYLSSIEQLDEVVHIYKINEVIFCSKDIRAQEIMYWMTSLGNDFTYKIVPQESISIIGSSSKNTTGELYTIDIAFQIATPFHRRNKRLSDILISLLLLLLLPLLFVLKSKRKALVLAIFRVLLGHKSWVGYIPIMTSSNLPSIKKGVFSPLSSLRSSNLSKTTQQRLNFLYAKDYTLSNDLYIIWKALLNW